MNRKNKKRFKRINRMKNRAYSSMYTIVCFFVSTAYVVVDIIGQIFFKNYFNACNLSAWIAFGLLLLSIMCVEIWNRYLRNGIENKYKKMKPIVAKMEKVSQSIGYWGFPLLGVTFLSAIIGG